MRKAIEGLNKCLKESRKKPVLFMLSGGSSLELLAGIEMRNIGKNITVTVLDERYSTDPAVNNFSQVTETEFYKRAEKKGIDYIDTRVRYRITLKGLAKKFERELQKWRKKHSRGRIIITQGIGPDGHTAGIMPYPENSKKFQKLFDKAGRWIVGYNATKKKTDYPKRITVTFPFLKEQVDCAIVYATGSKKTKAMRKIFKKKGTLYETPGRIIYQMKNVTVATDRR